MNLSFRIGSIPVRIQPSFFFTVLILGVLGVQDPAVVAAWIGVVLVSVLLHELGHAGAGLAFGLSPRIDLHAMGGTTYWSSASPLSTAKRIAISLAGPFAGFAVAALVRFGLGATHLPDSPLGYVVYRDLLFVNFTWGLVNLLPMLPLDGGNVMAQLLDVFTKGRGAIPSRIVSIVVAALAAVAGFLLSWSPGEPISYGNLWPVLLALSFVGLNARSLSELRAAQRPQEGKPPPEHGPTSPP